LNEGVNIAITFCNSQYQYQSTTTHLTDLYFAWLKNLKKRPTNHPVEAMGGGVGRFGVLGNPLAPKESIHATCPQLESAIACPFGSRKAANLGDAGYFIRSVEGPGGWRPEHS